MKESQIHQAFVKWLDAQRIPFQHNRTDKRSHGIKGEPDFCLALAGRCLLIEVKVLGGKLSPDQEKRIAYLRERGNKVVISYSLEGCVQATQEWAGIVNNGGLT